MNVNRLVASIKSASGVSGVLREAEKLSANVNSRGYGGYTPFIRNTKDEFPIIGGNGVLYISKREQALYLWDDDTASYVCIGRDGKSAYESALENDFNGTEREWLASLKGEKGDKGDKIKLAIDGEGCLQGWYVPFNE